MGEEARDWTSPSQVSGMRLGWLGKGRKGGSVGTSGEGGVNCFRTACISGLGEACSRACWEMVGWSRKREDGVGARRGGKGVEEGEF